MKNAKQTAKRSLLFYGPVYNKKESKYNSKGNKSFKLENR